MLLEAIAFIIFIVVLTLSIILNIVLNARKHRLALDVVKLAFEKVVLSKKIEQLVSEKETSGVENSDGFLKFVSQSRDWAFNYIEDVQKAIENLDFATKTKDTEQIKVAYDKLIDFLPKSEETNKKNK